MSNQCVIPLLLVGVIMANSLSANARSISDVNLDNSINFPDDPNLSPKRAWVFFDPEDPRFKEAGFRVLPPSESQKKKWKAAAVFMLSGRVGFFGQLYFWNIAFDNTLYALQLCIFNFIHFKRAASRHSLSRNRSLKYTFHKSLSYLLNYTCIKFCVWKLIY